MAGAAGDEGATAPVAMEKVHQEGLLNDVTSLNNGEDSDNNREVQSRTSDIPVVTSTGRVIPVGSSDQQQVGLRVPDTIIVTAQRITPEEDAAARAQKRCRLTLTELIAISYELNTRDDEGRPVAPMNPSGTFVGSEAEFFGGIDSLDSIHGYPGCLPEALALGDLSLTEYFLVPNSMTIPVCTIDNVLRGQENFKVDDVLVAQIYILAKIQATFLGLPEYARMKWAFLRTQAFIAGWYDRQRWTKFVAPPANALTRYSDYLAGNHEVAEQAWRLVGFLPFVFELSFRQRSETWSRRSLSGYEARAWNLAKSSHHEDVMNYLPAKLMHGKCLNWIGVARVRQVLHNVASKPLIPEVFSRYLGTCPASTAIISTTRAVINMMKEANMWKPISLKYNYNVD